MPRSDVLPFAEYLEHNLRRRPPDHLVVEWYAGETPQSNAYKNGRAHGAFRWNLLAHRGEVSTLRSDSMKGFPQCYEMLIFPILFEVDAFKPHLCPDDDLWPCPPLEKQTMRNWYNFTV